MALTVLGIFLFSRISIGTSSPDAMTMAKNKPRTTFFAINMNITRTMKNSILHKLAQEISKARFSIVFIALILIKTQYPFESFCSTVRAYQRKVKFVVFEDGSGNSPDLSGSNASDFIHYLAGS